MSTQVRLINPPELHPAPGFSHIAIAPVGEIAYIAGQTALAPDFSVIGPGDLAEQTRASMRNVETALLSIGASWNDVVRRTVYTSRPTDFAIITAAIEEIQGSTRHPAQTILGVTGLAIEGLLVEIEVTVHLPASR
ncbi:enamine deaminase RidA [Rhodococcus erythropolis]|uniref:Enamine deaminase RidA n=1 Tax=Rhodococcus erythropolis TaxID=1833 RepID=A0A0C3AEN4_RHOER|nr:enamine deaminase RidA [Rhodococcus erythropolis]KIM17756.1 endoribonuclease L-PSP [Rhodococcus erythropolis]